MGTTNRVKNCLFIILLVLMFLPMLQQQFGFVELKPLYGAITKEQDPCFSVESYIDESFQHQTEKYVNAEFGFRSTMIRIHNQIAFSLFDKTNAASVIIGKENYLFDLGYTESYFGKHFIGEDKIKEKLQKLKRIRDTLKTKNIDLLIIFASGKPRFYPEFIPDQLVTAKTTSNYDCYLSNIKDTGIPYIDFNDYFVKLKATSPYCLYPQVGVHWSNYAAALVGDSLNKYILQLRNLKGTQMIFKEIITRDSLSVEDKDAEEGCNLLFPIKKGKMSYPRITFEEKGRIKPKTLMISDSFYWGILGSGIANQIFENPIFWYYGHEVHGDGPTKKIENVNIKEQIEKQDVIMLMASEGNLNIFPYEFIERMDSIYFSGNKKL